MSAAPHDHYCVHVIDDEEPVRRTISFMLASAGISARTYPSAAAFLEEMPNAPPGCILTDFRLPGMSGLDLVRQLGAANDRHCIVVMSGYADIPLVVEAMKSGATDFLQKPFKKEALVSTIKAAVEKLRQTPSAAADPDEPKWRALFNTLTPRQHDVLRGMLDGKLNKTIAHELDLSVRTVESYRSEIFAKTQVTSLSELIRHAVLAGL